MRDRQKANEYQRMWREKNYEKCKQYSKNYNRSEKRKEAERKYREKNREKLNEYARQYKKLENVRLLANLEKLTNDQKNMHYINLKNMAEIAIKFNLKEKFSSIKKDIERIEDGTYWGFKEYKKRKYTRAKEL